jgi:hypothetical protein
MLSALTALLYFHSLTFFLVEGGPIQKAHRLNRWACKANMVESLPGLLDVHASACLARCQCLEPLATGDFIYFVLPDMNK